MRGSNPDRELIFSFCDGYKAFLDKAKTERTYVREAVQEAEKLGFEDLDMMIAEGLPINPGDKVYRVVGTRPLFLPS